MLRGEYCHGDCAENGSYQCDNSPQEVHPAPEHTHDNQIAAQADKRTNNIRRESKELHYSTEPSWPSMICSIIGIGYGSFMNASWNERRSNFAPCFARNFSRSDRISCLPSVYA